jgi:hypothetical protein
MYGALSNCPGFGICFALSYISLQQKLPSIVISEIFHVLHTEIILREQCMFCAQAPYMDFPTCIMFGSRWD